MQIVVPTGDFLRLLARLKPLKSITTTGFAFPIYTLEAYKNKVRLIISDNTSIVSSSEIFATVNEPGIVSLNGNDFFQMIAKIPAADNKDSGSKSLDLQSSSTKLNLSTMVHYGDIKKNISQKRAFTLVNTNLSARDDFDPQGDKAVRVKLPALYLSDVFKVLGKTVASYTSDMAGLSGVLIRCKAEKLLFVVSDGFRIIEISYPTPIKSKDFDIILPKLTCSLLQSLIYDGDELEILSDSHQVKFRIDTDGLMTSVVSSLIVAYFPPYESIFAATGEKVKLYTRLLADNISNVRQVLEEEPYRLKLEFSKKQLNLTNLKQSSHVSFSNDGLPLLSPIKTPFDLVVNAILMENSLSIIGSESITITVPGGGKPIIIDNEDNELRIKIAIALAEED